MQENLTSASQVATYSQAASDLYMHSNMLLSFLEEIDPEAWQQRERYVQGNEWTLHQTVAHLVASTEFYRSALQLALLRKTLTYPDFQQRKNLPTYNQREIVYRQHLQPSELITALRQALEEIAEMARQLSPEQFLWPIAIPVFNRPLTILELLEILITHSGVVHAAQIARPANKAPLWQRYDPRFMHRMLAHLFRLMTLTYWPERGGDLQATFQFLVAGTSGGEWYVTVSSACCQAGEGRIPRPQVTCWTADANTLCLLITGQLRIGKALLCRTLFVKGNLLLFTKFPQLFSPT